VNLKVERELEFELVTLCVQLMRDLLAIAKFLFCICQHCLAGWQSSRPSSIPAASGLDLRRATNGLQTQMTTVGFLRFNFPA